MTTPELYHGTLPESFPYAESLDLLLTKWDDGSLELAVRPAGSNATWSPPVALKAQPDRKHHPDCPAPHFPDRDDRCRCIFMAALDHAEDLNLRAQFEAEGRTRWSEADDAGNVTVTEVHPATPHCSDDCPTWLHSKAECACKPTAASLAADSKARTAAELDARLTAGLRKWGSYRPERGL